MSVLIRPATIAAAGRLAAAGSLLERVGDDIDFLFSYGWSIDEGSVTKALLKAARGGPRQADATLIVADRRFMDEFTCRIEIPTTDDYWEGDAEPSDYDLAPGRVAGASLSEALRLVISLAQTHGWIRQP
jgi:hypothetical protein